MLISRDVCLFSHSKSRFDHRVLFSMNVHNSELQRMFAVLPYISHLQDNFEHIPSTLENLDKTEQFDMKMKTKRSLP